MTINGRISLGKEVMLCLDVQEGDFVQLVINTEGPEVKIQKVMPYEV